MEIDPTKAAAAAAAPKPELTGEQKEALKRLHVAAQQFEAVFVNMLFKTMHAGDPKTTITGKVSNAEKTFSDMLDEKRSEGIASTGAFGIGKILEDQLKAQVLANPTAAAKARLPREGDL
jgi:Rod binding domain-containing protein